MTLTARQLYFEGTRVGDELPPLVKPPVDRMQIARYVGAAGDFNPLYVDEPHAKAAGFPSTRAPGMVAMGFMAELATEWVRGARLRRFQSRFVKIVWPNDVLTARGRVTERRFDPNGAYTIDVELWAENQKGELVARGVATFQLYYSADDETRQRAGQPPLLVTPEEEEARLARLSRAQSPRPPAPPRPLQPARPIGPPVPAATPGAPVRPGQPQVPPRPGAGLQQAPVRPGTGQQQGLRPPPPPSRPALPARPPLPPPPVRSAASSAPPRPPPAPPRPAAPPPAPLPRPVAKPVSKSVPPPAVKPAAKPAAKKSAAPPAKKKAAPSSAAKQKAPAPKKKATAAKKKSGR